MKEITSVYMFSLSEILFLFRRLG